eukprot:SAG22_NODE_1781_length_3596_cov_13.907921_2_plen_46_part_00
MIELPPVYDPTAYDEIDKIILALSAQQPGLGHGHGIIVRVAAAAP